MNDLKVEQTIQDKGLDHARVTPDRIEEVIRHTEFYVFPGSLMTVCQITLVNGFTVSGTSACAHPENFDSELGEQIAERNARNEIWALEGYLLKQRLFDQGL